VGYGRSMKAAEQAAAQVAYQRFVAALPWSCGLVWKADREAFATSF
jgi:hypothetical protein